MHAKTRDSPSYDVVNNFSFQATIDEPPLAKSNFQATCPNDKSFEKHGLDEMPVPLGPRNRAHSWAYVLLVIGKSINPTKIVRIMDMEKSFSEKVNEK
jgi:hypothetical protein